MSKDNLDTPTGRKNGLIVAMLVIVGMVAALVFSSPDAKPQDCYADCVRTGIEDGDTRQDVERGCAAFCKLLLLEDGTPAPE